MRAILLALVLMLSVAACHDPNSHPYDYMPEGSSDGGRWESGDVDGGCGAWGGTPNWCVGERAIDSLRKGAGKQIEIIAKSGKLQGGAIYATKRGGFLLLEVAQGKEVLDLLGAPIIDHFHVEAIPLISFEELSEFFKVHPIHSHT